ncbi:acyl-CoA dehydrogenase family protein [Nocardioides sp. Iso805N]|uniref:acyl-CoA dehydrogenase family protein n=1 Tax=Nocardioides sp. Iso805N TaxID=1283287 RepID=UPI000365AAD3|nr:acyl-CoA dehydrogenase family protein [Nocardioides sp. Iso805N]
MKSTFYTEEHDAFRAIVREFVEREVKSNLARWEDERLIDRQPWLAAGKQGVVGIPFPEEYGGAGQSDYRFRAIVKEELARVNATSLDGAFGINEDIVGCYIAELGTEEQKARYLPGMSSGEIVSSIAMTEPGAGSDLRGIRTSAVRDGDEWVINGSKTFITNGISSDVVVVAARTDQTEGRSGLSLLIVDTGTPGFERGRKLDKVGMHAQDTAELFFDNVRVPATNLLGTEGRGLPHLMERLPRERMSIAWYAIGSAEAVLDWTIDYTTNRRAYGAPIIDLQNTRFALAEMQTELDVTRAFLEAATLNLNAGELTAVDAAKAKWWSTELQKRVTDRCLQLHGGYGYMMEYPVGRAFIDSRIQTIYGGTTEVMKEIIGRDIAAAR